MKVGFIGLGRMGSLQAHNIPPASAVQLATFSLQHIA